MRLPQPFTHNGSAPSEGEATATGDHVLLWASGLCGAAGAAFGISGGFLVLPVIQVRTTFGCLPLSISNTILASFGEPRRTVYRDCRKAARSVSCRTVMRSAYSGMRDFPPVVMSSFG